MGRTGSIGTLTGVERQFRFMPVATFPSRFFARSPATSDLQSKSFSVAVKGGPATRCSGCTRVSRPVLEKRTGRATRRAAERGRYAHRVVDLTAAYDVVTM